MPNPSVAPGDRTDLLAAVDFAGKRFEEWGQRGRLAQNQHLLLQTHYARLRDELARADGLAQLPGLSAAADAGERPAHRSLRYWSYLCHEIARHQADGRLSLAQAHALQAEAREHLAALNRKLEPLDVVPVADDDAPPAAPRRTLLEILLDPRSIQWLLASGGVLLVLGIVIWLAALGVFKDPLVIAVCLGAGNAALLLGGWAAIRYTRYQFAGRALTLLACLLMPLNLWFYHAQGLLTLDHNLWMASLVCSVLYAASAWVLRDRLFVYVLNGGIALTGLLVLADMGKFWEIAAPATLLVAMGVVAIHLERAFADNDGPFSRKHFGLAFFWSGQALLGSGLVLLLGAQLVGGWLYEPFFRPVYESWHTTPPDIVTQDGGKLLALGLVLAAVYAYLYSDFVVRRVGVYVYLAAVAVLWAEVLALNLLPAVPMEAVIAALAVTALVVNLLQSQFTDRAPYLRAVPVLGLLLNLLPVVLGVAVLFRATPLLLGAVWPNEPGWEYVGAMLATVVSCRVGAYLYRTAQPRVTAAYFFATAAATLVGAVGLLNVLGVTTADRQAPVLMLLPIAYLVAARFYQGSAVTAKAAAVQPVWQVPLVWVAHLGTALVLVIGASGWSAGMDRYLRSGGDANTAHLLLALLFGEATLFYGLAAAFRKQGFNVYFATLAAGAALALLLVYGEVPLDYATVIYAGLGLVLLLAYRFAVLERLARTGLAQAAFESANGLMSLAFVAAVLRALGRLSTSPETIHWPTVLQLVCLAALSLAAAGLVAHTGWRRWYLVMAVAEAVLTVATFNLLIDLTPWQKIEIFSVVVGLGLLALGHAGWYREQDRQTDLVSFSLLFGSVLAGVPLAIATLIYRFGGYGVSMPNEIALLAVSMTLFVSGVLLRLRATTLVGGGLLGLHLLMLLATAFWQIPGQWIVGVSLAVGGGTIFLVGLLLSIYRDRLLALPEKIKRRDGVFRVLAWR